MRNMFLVPKTRHYLAIVKLQNATFLICLDLMATLCQDKIYAMSLVYILLAGWAFSEPNLILV